MVNFYKLDWTVYTLIVQRYDSLESTRNTWRFDF